MIIGADFKDEKTDFVDGYGEYVYGKWYETLKCQSCEQVELRYFEYDPDSLSGPEPITYFSLYPLQPEIPEGLPPKVKKEYQLALKARHGDSNGYGVWLGRVLEAVCQDKKAKGRMIGQQLQDLANRNVLPKEILAYASKLNSLRIAGAHFNVGKLSKKDIPIMERLTRTILEYVYTAPHIMKQAEKAVKKLGGNKGRSQTPPPPPQRKLIPPVRRIMVERAPSLMFNEISVDDPDYESHFLKFISKNECVKFDTYNVPTLPDSIKRALFAAKYVLYISTSQADMRYYVPDSIHKTVPFFGNETV
jgi:hypothetical protein